MSHDSNRTFICRRSEIPNGESRLAEFNGKPIVLFNIDGKIFATSELCPHRAGPISEGKITGTTVECPWHGAKFDICTGAVQGGPAARPLKVYGTILSDDDIFVFEASPSAQ